MANWCIARLIATGSRKAVAAFAETARARPRRIFKADMLVGESQGLRRERMERVDSDRYRKAFAFQVRNDDGFEHFRRLSKRRKTLSFVLVYCDPHLDLYGSYLLSAGRAHVYRLSERQKAAVMRKHGVTLENDHEWGYWEASWELMDLAEGRWVAAGGRPYPAPPPTSRGRKSGPKKKVRRAARG